MSLRSPVGRVLGLGAAKKGVGHWWSQRVTSVALGFLTLWFVASLLTFESFERTAVLAWIAAPLNTVLLSLLILTTAYHSQLGVQVVVEDYVEHKGSKVVTLLLLDFLHVALAALGLYAVLRIGFGAVA